MTLRWIGQSGYIIRTDSTEIMLDPYLSDVVNRVANRPRSYPAPFTPSDVKSDAVICTHDHLDHLDIDSVIDMRPDQLFVTTVQGVEKLGSLGQHNARALRVGDSCRIGDVEITAVFAKHTVEAIGVVIRAEGHTLYFSGDTLFDEELFGISAFKPDITFICINGKLGNMDYREALVTARAIGAKVNVPHHYDMFAGNTEDPQLFCSAIDGGFEMERNVDYAVTPALIRL